MISFANPARGMPPSRVLHIVRRKLADGETLKAAASAVGYHHKDVDLALWQEFGRRALKERGTA